MDKVSHSVCAPAQHPSTLLTESFWRCPDNSVYSRTLHDLLALEAGLSQSESAVPLDTSNVQSCPVRIARLSDRRLLCVVRNTVKRYEGGVISVPVESRGQHRAATNEYSTNTPLGVRSHLGLGYGKAKPPNVRTCNHIVLQISERRNLVVLGVRNRLRHRRRESCLLGHLLPPKPGSALYQTLGPVRGANVPR